MVLIEARLDEARGLIEEVRAAASAEAMSRFDNPSLTVAQLDEEALNIGMSPPVDRMRKGDLREHYKARVDKRVRKRTNPRFHWDVASGSWKVPAE